ncbi:MAG: HAD family phosphatase [Deltaproteobacteria bacterium]|nr:HAD family phosphatase [Deltaproteobacteria bacterium]
MQSIASFPSAIAHNLKGVLCDIDDTLTLKGKLSASAYQALWDLRKAGLVVVPVTGRPAGWCDLIVRQWPVSGVVGEDGAFAFYEEAGKLCCEFHPNVDHSGQKRLEEIAQEILATVPNTRISPDQAYRLVDFSIDYAEEPPILDQKAAQQIRDIFLSHGARAKISSIHVNGWFGDYDKLSMTHRFISEILGFSLNPEEWVFCGDSPNDEPMFAYFPYACAVANIDKFSDSMNYLPRYVASKNGGEGFAEIVEILLKLRNT